MKTLIYSILILSILILLLSDNAVFQFIAFIVLTLCLILIFVTYYEQSIKTLNKH